MRTYFPLFALILLSCTSKRIRINENKGIDSSQNTAKSSPKIISDSTNTLEGKVQQLQLEYIGWGCACANWITPADRKKFENSGLAEHCIFIEPADSNMVQSENEIAFTIEKQNILVTGRFYKKKDYPKGTIQTEEVLDKAKVFCYTSIRYIKK
jgi:hypothetical protein